MNKRQAENQAKKMAQWLWEREADNLDKRMALALKGEEGQVTHATIAELRRVEPPFHNVEATVRDLVKLGWAVRDGNTIKVTFGFGARVVADGNERTWKANASREFNRGR